MTVCTLVSFSDRYGYIDQDEDGKEHRPVAPKTVTFDSIIVHVLHFLWHSFLPKKAVHM